MTAVLSPQSQPPSSSPRPSSAGSSRSRLLKEALRISELIDDELRRDSARRKAAKKREVKVMLLGQAESGKSTLRKQFQLLYASRSLDVERLSWIPAVYLNIIKALRIIFAELEYEATLQTPDEPLENGETRDALDAIRIRLLPFVALENLLAAELSGGVSVSGGRRGAFVRSGWQSRIVPPWKLSFDSNKSVTPDRTRELTILVARTLTVAVDDIENLWNHEAVKFYVRQRKIPLDDSVSYFLSHIQRIGEPEYCPTNDDILHVRLQTLGVMEHTFPVSLAGRTYQWKMYDVGGARGQRQTWVPYFDDATAIIFLAPVSAFDQYLEEDPKVNRVEDSLQLWTSICSNKLLKNANLVLLLNKTDILREKLEAGVAVRKYITSFGDRPNNFETVADYFRAHFLQAHRRNHGANQPLYVHFTSMLDVKATQSIISSVGEVIVRKHISQMGLI